MFYFFKNASIPSLKLKMTYIYILNTLDIIFTFALLRTGLFEEANKLMVNIVEDALLSIIIKLILPAILMIYILLNLDQLSDTYLPICNISINIVFIVYFIIACMHICYLLYFIQHIHFTFSLFFIMIDK